MLFQTASIHQSTVGRRCGHPRRALTILCYAMLLANSPALVQSGGDSREHAIFKSADRGRTWSRSDQGITGNPRVNAFASAGDFIIAGTDSAIFVSHDEAQTWRTADKVPANSGRILALLSLEKIVIAGTDRNGLLVSSDRGNTWTHSSSFPSRYVRTLLTDGKNVYAGTDSEGAFVSKDNGQSWKALSDGLPANAQVFALTMLQGKLFAGLYSKGLYTLDPKAPGKVWTKIGNVSPLALATFGNALLAGHNPGGIHWSDDGGSNWSKGTLSFLTDLTGGGIQTSGEAFGPIPVWELASNGILSLAGAGGGIYFSEDQGHTWTRARSGLPKESSGISFLLKPTFVLAGAVIKAGDPCAVHPTKGQIKTKSGLIYEIIRDGAGAGAQPGQTVLIHESMGLANGRQIMDTREKNRPVKFLLGGNQVIAGVDEGVTGMKVGERRKLTVPPSLDGRKFDPSFIPEGSILHYDIELLEIVK